MKRCNALLAICLTTIAGTKAGATDLSLQDTLTLVLQNHPAVQAEKYRDEARREEISQARAAYYPQLNAEGILSTGFPGSSGSLGVRGVMGSSFRKGPAAGLLLEQNIFDFGRTSGRVSVAQKRRIRDQADSKVQEIQIALGAIEAYYACAKDRALADFYRNLVTDARQVEKEVARYIRSGQRSIVDKYLSEAQSEEAVTFAADYQRRWEIDRQQLAVLIGAETAQCQDLATSAKEAAVASRPADTAANPFVARAQAEVSISESEAQRARSDYYPRIVGVASFGYLDDTQLDVPMKNYSVGVGVIIPLFEGFKTNAEVSRYRAETMQREKEADAVKRALAETNLNYDRQIESAKVRVDHLNREVELAQSAFRLAKTRYFSKQGKLVDLRESINNLLRTQRQQKEAVAEMLAKTAQKNLVNGATVAANR